MEWQDKATKEQTTSNDQQINEKLIPHTDMGETIRRSVRSIWQRSWKEIPPYRNHLKYLKPEIGNQKTSHNKIRRFETTLSRLKIGHTNITQSYGMQISRPPQPHCEIYNTPFTVKHLIVECTNFHSERKKLLRNRTLQQILGETGEFSDIRLKKLFKRD